MTLEEFENATLGELRARANGCFTKAEVAGGLDKPYLFSEAQFYIGEMERRKQGRANTVSFWMEVAVIVLILGEIVIGIVEGNSQTTVLGGQTEILRNLDRSTSATAVSLQSLQSTTAAMNSAVQDQLALFYDPSIAASFVNATKELQVMNLGRTNIELWGSKLGIDPAIFFKRASIIPPTAGYRFESKTLYDQLANRVPKTSTLTAPYDLYIKTERAKEFARLCT